jgi:hypothetical protein
MPSYCDTNRAMNVGKSRRIRVLATALDLVFGVGATGATIAYVNDATRGPRDTLIAHKA